MKKLITTIGLLSCFNAQAAPLTADDIQKLINKDDCCRGPVLDKESYEDERLYALERRLITEDAYHLLKSLKYFSIISRHTKIIAICPDRS